MRKWKGMQEKMERGEERQGASIGEGGGGEEGEGGGRGKGYKGVWGGMGVVRVKGGKEGEIMEGGVKLWGNGGKCVVVPVLPTVL